MAYGETFRNVSLTQPIKATIPHDLGAKFSFKSLLTVLTVVAEIAAMLAIEFFTVGGGTGAAVALGVEAGAEIATMAATGFGTAAATGVAAISTEAAAVTAAGATAGFSMSAGTAMVANVGVGIVGASARTGIDATYGDLNAISVGIDYASAFLPIPTAKIGEKMAASRVGKNIGEWFAARTRNTVAKANQAKGKGFVDLLTEHGSMRSMGINVNEATTKIATRGGDSTNIESITRLINEPSRKLELSALSHRRVYQMIKSVEPEWQKMARYDIVELFLKNWQKLETGEFALSKSGRKVVADTLARLLSSESKGGVEPWGKLVHDYESVVDSITGFYNDVSRGIFRNKSAQDIVDGAAGWKHYRENLKWYQMGPGYVRHYVDTMAVKNGLMVADETGGKLISPFEAFATENYSRSSMFIKKKFNKNIERRDIAAKALREILKPSYGRAGGGLTNGSKEILRTLSTGAGFMTDQAWTKIANQWYEALLPSERNYIARTLSLIDKKTLDKGFNTGIKYEEKLEHITQAIYRGRSVSIERVARQTLTNTLTRESFTKTMQDIVYTQRAIKTTLSGTHIVRYLGSKVFNDRWVQKFQLVDPNDSGRFLVEFGYQKVSKRLITHIDKITNKWFKKQMQRGARKEVSEWTKMMRGKEMNAIKNTFRRNGGIIWGEGGKAGEGTAHWPPSSRYILGHKVLLPPKVPGGNNVVLIKFNKFNTMSERRPGGKRDILVLMTNFELAEMTKYGTSYWWNPKNKTKGWWLSRGGTKKGRGTLELGNLASLFLGFFPVAAVRNVGSIISNWVENGTAIAKGTYFNNYGKKFTGSLERALMNRSARLMTRVIAGRFLSNIASHKNWTGAMAWFGRNAGRELQRMATITTGSLFRVNNKSGNLEFYVKGSKNGTSGSSIGRAFALSAMASVKSGITRTARSHKWVKIENEGPAGIRIGGKHLMSENDWNKALKNRKTRARTKTIFNTTYANVGTSMGNKSFASQIISNQRKFGQIRRIASTVTPNSVYNSRKVGRIKF